MEFVCLDQELIAQSAIHHHADHFEVRAAVTGTASASIAMSTINVRLNTASISDRNIGHPRADREYLNA
jgi:hypothetical protein